MHVYVYMCMCMDMYICMYVYMCICMWVGSECVIAGGDARVLELAGSGALSLSLSLYLYIYIYMCVLYVCVFMYVCVCVCMHMAHGMPSSARLCVNVGTHVVISTHQYTHFAYASLQKVCLLRRKWRV